VNDAMVRVVVPQRIAAAAALGLAASLVVRCTWPVLAVAGAAAVAGCAFVRPERAAFLVVAAAALGALWWGSTRLAELDRSGLLARVGWSETTLLTVTGPPRRGRFELRLPARVARFGRLVADEPVLLELPLGRAPPQGARLEVLGELVLPREPSNGFDEGAWLSRQGVHVVLRGDRWRMVGTRGGLPGLADRLRVWLGRSSARGLAGERRGIVEGVVLGDDAGLSDGLRRDFRASGLYHLLAVSGQNVALVAGSALFVAWLAGLPRLVGELGALAAIGAYVLAVGAQPSVVRAAVAGALGSLAWLAARQKDRWHFLLLGAIVLLAWNPYTLLDPGFELSFAAVVSIFTLAPRIRRVLDGYPVPGKLADVVAVSTACGLATAPVSWFQFHAVPVLTVPANALAAPAVVPLLGLGLATAAATPLSGETAATLADLNGWCAAYLAGCARLVGGLPFAQIRSGRAAAVLAGGLLLGTAYAWRRWRPS
jgi:competence protein ComEC